MIPVIATSRLILRPFTEEDIDPFHRILSGEGVLRYFPRTEAPSRDRVERLVLGMLSHWQERGYGLWAVASQGTGELMGRCGLQYLSETNEVEVDFLLGRAHWGQGFATEAGRASVRYGFETLGLEGLVGIVHLGNRASRRVLEKLGMRRVEKKRYFGMDCFRYEIRASWYTGGSASSAGGP